MTSLDECKKAADALGLRYDPSTAVVTTKTGAAPQECYISSTGDLNYNAGSAGATGRCEMMSKCICKVAIKPGTLFFSIYKRRSFNDFSTKRN